MKEIKDIIKAYDEAILQKQQTALATVVQVEGSSYRQPGARMLVTEKGELTGAISGGCLEGDALRKAQLAMTQQKPMLVTYDTNDEDDAKLGLGLGCNGIIHILIEPIHPEQEHHPIALLKKATAQRQLSIIATAYSLHHRKGQQRGTCLLLQNKNQWNNEQAATSFTFLLANGKRALQSKTSLIETHEEETIFFELIQPTIQLVIAGGGNDVMPLVKMANILGWETTVADGRSNYATANRFPAAACTLMAKPEILLKQMQVDEQTAVLLMTHNYNYDLAMLRGLLPLHLPYIGLLGPRKKKERLLNELQEEGIDITADMLTSIYGPTGLDIGAETAEEIALSIVAEIKAVFSNKNGQMLREKTEPIHAGNQSVNAAEKDSAIVT